MKQLYTNALDAVIENRKEEYAERETNKFTDGFNCCSTNEDDNTDEIDELDADCFTLELSASNFDAPLQIQDGEEKTRAADFSAALMNTGLATSPDGLDLNFDFQDNTFTLADLPVDVSLTELRGEGASTDAGLDMDYSVLGARIADGMNEPENAMYQPLLFSGEGKLTDKSVTAEGRLRLADRQALIGNLSVSHEFEPNAGRATQGVGIVTASALSRSSDL